MPMEETTAREKEVLRSLLSMERGDLTMNEVGRPQVHAQPQHQGQPQTLQPPQQHPVPQQPQRHPQQTQQCSVSQAQQHPAPQPQQHPVSQAQQHVVSQAQQMAVSQAQQMAVSQAQQHPQQVQSQQHAVSQAQQLQQQPQQQIHHHYTRPEEPRNLSTSQQQMAGMTPVDQGEMQHHHHHQQHQQQQHQHQGHHPGEHQQHNMQPQQGMYKPDGTQDATMHGCVQWMSPTSSSGHQVIILHAPPDQQGDAGNQGMASIIQAAEQGQLVGQQVWETHVADYQAGVQLSDGTIIPTHPDYPPQPGCGTAQLPAGSQPPPPQPNYVLVESKPAGGDGSPAVVPPPGKVKKPAKKKKRKLADMLAEGIDPSKLEESADEVRLRFEKGCECAEENCFKTLNSDFVYRHRLNIAELAKHEHDMYLMGVTMASLANPDETARHKERKRLRTKYVFQGKEVCLDAFLYLENCTHYQLKRIRKHVITHGVTPRVHGNHGKRAHNTFPLDIYRHASDFLSDYLAKFAHKGETKKTKAASATSRRQTVSLPPEITRKKIHEEYMDFINQFSPATKMMSYSAFRYFLRDQFAHVKFAKVQSSQASEPALSSDVKLEETVIQSGHNSIDLQGSQAVVSTLLPAPESQPADPASTFGVPEHHQTTTYTVTTRPYTAPANVQMHYSGSSYHYSITM